MKNTALAIPLLLIPIFLFSQSRVDPPRLKRADSFFGVHFDFHAGPDCIEIGKTVDEALIENIVSQVRPDIANAFLYRSTPVVREFLNALIQEMDPGLMTEVKGSHWVDVTLNRLGDSTILNLVNSAGPHDNDKVLVFDEIPALGPIQISIRYPSKPKRVMVQPENKVLDYTYEKGVIQCTLPLLKIHEMVVIE